METVVIHGVRAKVARTFAQRAKGLIGTKDLAPGEGLLILKCNAIHTFFMRFPIDATFLDGEDRVVKVVRNIRPWRLWVWGGWRARKVLETKAGAFVSPPDIWYNFAHESGSYETEGLADCRSCRSESPKSLRPGGRTGPAGG